MSENMRQYKILSSTTATTLEEYVRAKSRTFLDLKVEGFAYDATLGYIALVSYEEIPEVKTDEKKSD